MEKAITSVLAEQLSVPEPGRRLLRCPGAHGFGARATRVDGSRSVTGLRILEDRSILNGWSFPLNRSRIFSSPHGSAAVIDVSTVGYQT